MTNALGIPETSGVTLIHASAAHVDNQALVFLGPRGAGKSTICHLLSAHFQPLADDKVYLLARPDGKWEVAGADGHTSPRRGRLVSTGSVSLLAIFRLHQATEPRLEPMSAMETCRHLTTAFFEIPWQQHYDTEVKRAAFATLAAAAKAVAGYHFHFDPSPRTAKVIERMIRWE